MEFVLWLLGIVVWWVSDRFDAENAKAARQAAAAENYYRWRAFGCLKPLTFRQDYEGFRWD